MTVGLFDRNVMSGLTGDGKRSPKQINCSVINFISTKADTLKYHNLNVTRVFFVAKYFKVKDFSGIPRIILNRPIHQNTQAFREFGFTCSLYLEGTVCIENTHWHIGHRNSFANVSPNCSFFNCRESLKWVSMVAQIF